ncbi:hypothetical protein Poly51_12910 [Rubripirellula tenax]|uniref:Uncharacterized protein n=1 Tax=Rubripirellula tenax TaxID=2528015 RepID=A0A5C6FCR6_9BACT|nr:hypothetical protein Poly51_12910 [Rubripirellula tenax]
MFDEILTSSKASNSIGPASPGMRTFGMLMMDGFTVRFEETNGKRSTKQNVSHT